MNYFIVQLLVINFECREQLYSKTCLSRTPLGLKNLFRFKQVFDLHKFKLHRQLVDGTVKYVWFRQVLGLLRVWFRQVFGLLRVWFRQVFGLLRVWFRQVFGLLRVWFRQVFGIIIIKQRQSVISHSYKVDNSFITSNVLHSAIIIWSSSNLLVMSYFYSCAVDITMRSNVQQLIEHNVKCHVIFFRLIKFKISI